MSWHTMLDCPLIYTAAAAQTCRISNVDKTTMLDRRPVYAVFAPASVAAYSMPNPNQAWLFFIRYSAWD